MQHVMRRILRKDMLSILQENHIQSDRTAAFDRLLVSVLEVTAENVKQLATASMPSNVHTALPAECCAILDCKSWRP